METTEKKVSHTPGPWSVVEHNWNETSVSSENETICSLRIPEGDDDELTDEEAPPLVPPPDEEKNK